MTLKEKILQTFIVTVREINKHGGPKEFFEKYPVGGMYYSVLPGAEDTVEMGTGTSYKRLCECRKYSKVPLLVCADGAGITGAKYSCGPSALVSSKNLKDAYDYGKLLGMQMNFHGVDWLLGPSVDLLYDRSMPLYAASDDPKLTAKVYSEVVRGLQDQGVCATLKHFPGLGTNSINMHFGHGRNVLDFDEWMNSYGYLYKELFKTSPLSVMTTHVSLKSYTDEYENGYYPIATYSKRLTNDLLKEELGFEGAVVTDALIMGGMATGNLIEETVQAFKSGADLLLWPPVEAADRIEELILSGEIPESRLDEALARIQKMRDFRNKALQEKKYEEPTAEKADEISKRVTAHGICEYKNEIGLLPLNTDKVKNILIVNAAENENSKAASNLADALNKAGFNAEVKRDIYDVPSRVCWQDDIDELQSKYDLTIFSMSMDYATSWSVSFMMVWASQLFDKNKKLIINYGSPFFAEDYFAEEHTIVEVNNGADEKTVELLVERLLGKEPFTGTKVLTEHTKKI